MCHKCRGGAGKETKSIIASMKTRAFLDGQRCGSALQGPKLVRHHNPGDYKTHRDEHIDLLPRTKRGMDRELRGEIRKPHNNHHHISCSIGLIRHVVLYGVFDLALLRPIYKRYLYKLVFEHPISQRKEIETKRKGKAKVNTLKCLRMVET
jgi:hypothetical protein